VIRSFVIELIGDWEMSSSNDLRLQACEFFRYALRESNIPTAFDRQVSLNEDWLRIGENSYDLAAFTRVFVVSIGKAGHSLAAALQARTSRNFEGVVADSVCPATPLSSFRYFFGGHPTPNKDSVRAAEAILASLNTLDSSSLVIFMISGGASSIAEKLLDPDHSLEDLIATYRTLVHSGAPIAQINAIRKHLSAIKGGRLALAAHPARQVSILISDVPDNALDALASGPTMPDSTTCEDCYAIAAKYGMVNEFPPAIRKIFRDRSLRETPKAGDTAFQGSRWVTLLSNHVVVRAVTDAASKAGFNCEVDNTCDDWDYTHAAEYLLRRLGELRKKSPRVCLVSGGEVTVKVTDGGVGGRNQQFALECARRIAGEHIAVLSAGTDGVDGNSKAAGAVADGTTIARGRQHGMDAQRYLQEFNAFPFFEKLGDAIITGPTGNNLRDVRMLLAT
jgi:hydroxypyruvate reductase